ncbi:hypothetical protein MJ389_25895 [Escherichia coli]|nr:hypothetical protein MJ389_25895 [Escherichia coli]
MKRKLSWMCAVAVGMCSWYPLASYAAPAAVANAAPGVQPQAATPAAPIVVGEPTATLAEPTAPAAVAENVPQRDVKLTFAQNCAAAGQHGATWHNGRKRRQH